MEDTVAIVGPGAIGLGLAASVIRAGHRVTLFGRRPHPGFDHSFSDQPAMRHEVPVHADPAPARARWVVLATKAHHTASARPFLEPLDQGAMLAVVQNGVDHRERVADLWQGEVLPVIISMPSARTGPTSVHQRRQGQLVVPEGPHAEAFATLFDDRVAVQATPDWRTVAWTKLLTNASLGACAILGLANGDLLTPPLRALGEGLIREVVAVGRAEGAAFDDADALVEATFAKIAKTPEHRSSITEDYIAGRTMEWDARNQVVVRTAARHGLDVPLNRAVATLLATADAAR